MLKVSSPAPPSCSGAPRDGPASLAWPRGADSLLGDLGGVRIDALLDREQLVADDAPDLLAKRDELGRQRVPGKRGHRVTLREPPRRVNARQPRGPAAAPAGLPARWDPGGRLGRGAQPPPSLGRARRRGGAEAHPTTHLSRLRQRIVPGLDAREPLEDLGRHRRGPSGRLAHVKRHQLVRRGEKAVSSVVHLVEIVEALGIPGQEPRGEAQRVARPGPLGGR